MGEEIVKLTNKYIAKTEKEFVDLSENFFSISRWLTPTFNVKYSILTTKTNGFESYQIQIYINQWNPPSLII